MDSFPIQHHLPITADHLPVVGNAVDGCFRELCELAGEAYDAPITPTQRDATPNVLEHGNKLDPAAPYFDEVVTDRSGVVFVVRGGERVRRCEDVAGTPVASVVASTFGGSEGAPHGSDARLDDDRGDEVFLVKAGRVVEFDEEGFSATLVWRPTAPGKNVTTRTEDVVQEHTRNLRRRLFDAFTQALPGWADVAGWVDKLRFNSPSLPQAVGRKALFFSSRNNLVVDIEKGMDAKPPAAEGSPVVANNNQLPRIVFHVIVMLLNLTLVYTSFVEGHSLWLITFSLILVPFSLWQTRRALEAYMHVVPQGPLPSAPQTHGAPRNKEH